MEQGKAFVTRGNKTPLPVKELNRIGKSFSSLAGSFAEVSVAAGKFAAAIEAIRPALKKGFCRAHYCEFLGSCAKCRAQDAAQLEHEQRLEAYRRTQLAVMDRSNIVERCNGLPYWRLRVLNRGGFEQSLPIIPGGVRFSAPYASVESAYKADA